MKTTNASTSTLPHFHSETFTNKKNIITRIGSYSIPPQRAETMGFQGHNTLKRRRCIPLFASFSFSSSIFLFLFLLISTTAISAVKIERHLAVEGEAATFVASGGGAWIRLPQQKPGGGDKKAARNHNLAFQMLSSDGQNAIDDSIDKDKFRFEKLPNNRYKLVIWSVSFADAGVYGCGNDYKFELEVASKPKCVDLKYDIYENRMTKFQCQVKVTKNDLVVPMRWTFRKKTKQGSVSQSGETVTSTYALTPSMDDNGEDLTCSLGALNGWVMSKAKKRASCQFSDLNVRFNPRLECERIQQVSELDKFYQVSCSILSNPIIPKDNISWYMVNDANMRESMDVRLLEFDVMNNGVKIIVAVPKKIISPRYPYQTVVVHARGESESATKNVMLELLYAPKIDCPKQRVVSLSLPTYQVSCEILANPMVDIGNITWKFQNHTRRIGDQSHDNRVIQGGIRVIMTLDEDMMSGFKDKTVERLRVGVTGPEEDAYVEDAVALRGIVVIDDKKDEKTIDWTKESFEGDIQNEEMPKDKKNVFGIFFNISDKNLRELVIMGLLGFSAILFLVLLLISYCKGMICGGSQKVKPYVQYKERRANWNGPGYNIVKSSVEEELSVSHLDVEDLPLPPPPPPPPAPRAPSPPPGPTALEQAAAIASGGGPIEAIGGGKHRKRKGSKSAQNSPGGGIHKGYHKPRQSPGRQHSHGSSHVPPPPPPPSATKAAKAARDASCISAPVSACSTPWHLQDPPVAVAAKSGSYGNLLDEENWQNGFSKMSAALRTKDADHDGYLTTDEVMSVVDSYNMVYRLGLGRDRLEEALKTCSNGSVVDFETLLHMLKQLAGHS